MNPPCLLHMKLIESNKSAQKLFYCCLRQIMASDFSSQNTVSILEEFMEQMTSAKGQLISKANFLVLI